MSLEEWKNEKRRLLVELQEKQRMEMKQVCATSASLFSFFQARGKMRTRESVANTAVILARFPKAQEVRTMQEWNKAGRRVKQGEKSIWITAKEGRYWKSMCVFEHSQTHGIEQEQKEPERNLSQAITNICHLSNAEVVQEATGSGRPAEYDPEQKIVRVNTDAPDGAVVFYLTDALVRSYLESGAGSSEKESQLYGIGAAIEVCSRLKIRLSEKTAQKLEESVKMIEPGTEEEVLENIAAFAQLIGDCACREIPAADRKRNAVVRE